MKYLMGLGQDSRCATSSCVQLSSVIVNVLRGPDSGAMIVDPITWERDTHSRIYIGLQHRHVVLGRFTENWGRAVCKNTGKNALDNLLIATVGCLNPEILLVPT